MSNRYETLFTPFKIGNCEIRNRIVIPAMEGTNIIENMFVTKYNEKAHDYYIERAKNNVGLFIPGMIPVYSMMMGKWLHTLPETVHSRMYCRGLACGPTYGHSFLVTVR